jgi:hypothetical protein
VQLIINPEPDPEEAVLEVPEVLEEVPKGSQEDQ